MMSIIGVLRLVGCCGSQSPVYPSAAGETAGSPAGSREQDSPQGVQAPGGKEKAEPQAGQEHSLIPSVRKGWRR